MTTIDKLSLKREKSDFQKVKINTAEDAANFIRQFYQDDITIYESFFILLLNRSGKTIAYAKISQGGTCGTVVDTKIIAKYCIDSLAIGIILCHNHPSGDCTPSKSDIQMTKKIKKALELIDVTVLDHIILTEDNFYSLNNL